MTKIYTVCGARKGKYAYLDEEKAKAEAKRLREEVEMSGSYGCVYVEEFILDEEPERN